MIGEVLGNRYEIQEKIGEGGMSIVYKARCNKLERNVAVKILKKELADNEEIVNKFKREATAIATLSDTNIVNVLDVGTQENLNYIVMEYVKGKTLKELINQVGKLNYETAITIGIQIAKALDCAHKNNIIHRDVKPQNILVTEEGVIKVTDFGIAKSSTSATLTNTTTIMGSAHYFSPEQAKGSFVDARTDLYSLGVVLYEMVTGKLPFEADSPVTIALKHIQEDVVAPKEINSKVPDSLNKLILKAMEKDTSKRYQTAKEIISDLQKIKEDPDTIIGDALNNDTSDHTIVMAPVNVDNTKAAVNKSLEEDYYDDEEDYEDDEYYDDEDDENDETKKKKKKKLIITIASVIGVLLALGLGAFFLFGGGSATDDGQSKVPNLEGMTIQEAKDTLEKLGLVYEEANEDTSELPKGTIISFYPAEGTMLKKGEKVRVIISKGKTELKMLDFSGQSIDELNLFIKKHNLQDAAVTEDFSDDVAEGKIISTNPKVDTVIDEKTKISVVKSKGPKVKKVMVPNVKGWTESEAEAKLKGFGLNVSKKTQEVDSESQKGIVVGQTIFDREVEEGTTVTITIGVYEEKKPTVNLDQVLQKGMSEQAVKAALGNKVGYNITGVKGGVLESWTPVGIVEEGTKVTFVFVEAPKDNSNNQ